MPAVRVSRVAPHAPAAQPLQPELSSSRGIVAVRERLCGSQEHEMPGNPELIKVSKRLTSDRRSGEFHCELWKLHLGRRSRSRARSKSWRAESRECRTSTIHDRGQHFSTNLPYSLR